MRSGPVAAGDRRLSTVGDEFSLAGSSLEVSLGVTIFVAAKAGGAVAKMRAVERKEDGSMRDAKVRKRLAALILEMPPVVGNRFSGAPRALPQAALIL